MTVNAKPKTMRLMQNPTAFIAAVEAVRTRFGYGHDLSCGCPPSPLVLAAEWVGHVDAARCLAGAGSADRSGDHGDVRFPEDGAAPGGGDPGSVGPVAGR